MRRIAIGLAAAAAAATAAGALAATRPALHIVSRAPLVVTGSHFRARERVTLEVGGSKVVVRTTRLGTFRAHLGSPAGDPCSLRVLALGLRGEHVIVPLALRAMCAPASPASPAGPAAPVPAA